MIFSAGCVYASFINEAILTVMLLHLQYLVIFARSKYIIKAMVLLVNVQSSLLTRRYAIKCTHRRF